MFFANARPPGEILVGTNPGLSGRDPLQNPGGRPGGGGGVRAWNWLMHKVCSISFDLPANYLWALWQVFPPKYNPVIQNRLWRNNFPQKSSIQITLHQRLQKREKEETTTDFAF